MERAQNSDSETHVKKLNQTFRTDLSRKSLSYIFWNTLWKGNKKRKSSEFYPKNDGQVKSSPILKVFPNTVVGTPV